MCGFSIKKIIGLLLVGKLESHSITTISEFYEYIRSQITAHRTQTLRKLLNTTVASYI